MATRRTGRQGTTPEAGAFSGLRCGIYCRKSNEDDGSEELRSVARQAARARAYAAQKGWTVADDLVFVDDGISGAEFKRRPGLARLLNAAEAKAFDVLVMSEPSRLGREQAETAFTLKRIADAGAEVWYYLEDRRAELDTAVGKFIEAVHSFGSELERERTRQRTLDGMLRRAQAGYSTGGRIYGYRSIPVHTGRQDAQGRQIPDYVDRRIESDKARTIVGIFQMYARGYGMMSIAKCLNGAPRYADELVGLFGGVRPPAPSHRSGSWVDTAIGEILRRPLYAGRVEWGRKNRTAPLVTVERPDLRIVPPDLWAAVQARLRERSEAYLRQSGGRLFGRAEASRESLYLWSGFLQCAVCGGAMVVAKKIYRPARSYYGCNFHVKRGKTICRNNTFARVEALDRALLDSVEATVLTPEALAYVLDRAAEAVRRSLTDDPGQMEALRRRRAETQRKITRLVEAVAEGEPPRALLAQIKALEGELVRLDGETGGLEARARLAQLDVARALRELEPALAAWRDILRGNAIRARQILRKLVVGRVVMTPMPEVHGYRWKGQLNGGAVLEGAQKYLSCRGPGAGAQPPTQGTRPERFDDAGEGGGTRCGGIFPGRSD